MTTIILESNGQRIDDFEMEHEPADYIQVPVFCDLHVCYETGHFFKKGIHDDGIIYSRVMNGA